jgi:hypothetical protein
MNPDCASDVKIVVSQPNYGDTKPGGRFEDDGLPHSHFAEIQPSRPDSAHQRASA